jgi:hypothetical protein
MSSSIAQSTCRSLLQPKIHNAYALEIRAFHGSGGLRSFTGLRIAHDEEPEPRLAAPCNARPLPPRLRGEMTPVM